MGRKNLYDGVTCATEGCERPANVKGKCRICYKGEWDQKTYQPHPLSIRFCSVEGCGKKHEAKGLCRSHYMKSRYGYKRIRRVNPDHAQRLKEAGYTLSEMAQVFGVCRQRVQQVLAQNKL